MKKIVQILLLFTCTYAFTQSNFNSNIWYFGDSCGVDFNNSTPLSLTNSGMYAWEGCATICDQNGQLLFYTNGIDVWNRNHQIMPNGSGLTGDPSTTQAAIIIPKPNDTNLFFIIVPEVAEFCFDFLGLRYSVVDMSLNGGLGDINSEKNILLKNHICEKVVAIPHSNNQDVWFVVHEWDSQNYLSYLITSSGIDTIPVVSTIGTPNSVFCRSGGGYIKSSRSGTKIAAVTPYYGTVEIFDFNRTIGTLSNCICSPYTYSDYYGAEFSPDESKLYVTNINNNELIQFDLSDPNPLQNFISIAYADTLIGAVQLAPDTLIYLASYGNNYLGVINHPDSLGIACDFNPFGINLVECMCTYGLPPLIHKQITTPVIVNQKNKKELIIYPNPTKEYLNINANELESIEIINSYGKSIITLGEVYFVDLRDFENGVYYFKIKFKEKVIIKKVIKI